MMVCFPRKISKETCSEGIFFTKTPKILVQNSSSPLSFDNQQRNQATLKKEKENLFLGHLLMKSFFIFSQYLGLNPYILAKIFRILSSF